MECGSLGSRIAVQQKIRENAWNHGLEQLTFDFGDLNCRCADYLCSYCSCWLGRSTYFKRITDRLQFLRKCAVLGGIYGGEFCSGHQVLANCEPEAVPFRRPVDPIALQIPDYFDVIKKPMDSTRTHRQSKYQWTVLGHCYMLRAYFQISFS